MTGTGSFPFDQRGSYERDFLLNDETLARRFKTWLIANMKTVTTDSAQSYINDRKHGLFALWTTADLKQQGLTLPLCRSTAAVWLQKSGCSVG